MYILLSSIIKSATIDSVGTAMTLFFRRMPRSTLAEDTIILLCLSNIILCLFPLIYTYVITAHFHVAILFDKQMFSS